MRFSCQEVAEASKYIVNRLFARSLRQVNKTGFSNRRSPVRLARHLQYLLSQITLRVEYGKFGSFAAQGPLPI